MRHKLSPAKYRELKKEVWERDQFCRLCGGHSMLTPHHIIARGMGGGDHKENLITLCIECHGEVEQGKKSIPDSILEEIGFFNLSYDTATRTQGKP